MIRYAVATCISDRVFRWLRWLTVAAAVATATLIAVPAPACACSCAVATDAEHLHLADLAFEGVVVDVDDPLLPSSDANPVSVRFHVESVSKGTIGDRVMLRTARDEASCGFQFALGHRYQVYAVGELTDRCSGNRDLGAAPDVPLEEGWAWPLIGGVAVGAAAVGSAVLLRRSRRSRSF